jgi:hypothetical protein
MDVPVGTLYWEVFVPDDYSVRTIGGNVIDKPTYNRVLIADRKDGAGYGYGVGSATGHGSGGVDGGIVGGARVWANTDGPFGQIRGHVVDVSGAVLPGVTVELEAGAVRRTVTTGGSGTFTLSGVPAGPVAMTARLLGFESQRVELTYEQRSIGVDFVLRVGSVAETVTVSGQAAKDDGEERRREPSQNVINLQRRATGVLPVRIDVPRAGTSHQFVKPLVVDAEAIVGFRYKRR